MNVIDIKHLNIYTTNLLNSYHIPLQWRLFYRGYASESSNRMFFSGVSMSKTSWEIIHGKSLLMCNPLQRRVGVVVVT